jgi:signal transduction histidine kinase
MASGGTLGLGVDVVEVDAHSAAPHPQAMPGRHVRIAVTDDGEGMPADVLDRIFDPFYTTKPQGAGTGLGLSVSASIVASHGGFIDVDSQPGRGSRFRVHLPVMAEGPAASTPDAHESLQDVWQTAA